MIRLLIAVMALVFSINTFADSKTDHILLGIAAGALGYYMYDKRQEYNQAFQQPYYQSQYAPQGRTYTCTKHNQTMANLTSSDAMALGAQGFSCW